MMKKIFGEDRPRHRGERDRDDRKDKKLQQESATQYSDKRGSDGADTEPEQHKAKRKNFGDDQCNTEHEPEDPSKIIHFRVRSFRLIITQAATPIARGGRRMLISSS